MSSGLLVRLGLSKKQNKSCEIFESIFPTIFDDPYESPSEFMKQNWSKYLEDRTTEHHDNSVGGHIFEYLLGLLLFREGIKPLFISARVAFVPNVIFDLMLYEKGGSPICISAKTSLRERYKQADLEAMALKNVHRRAKNYLVCYDLEAYGLKEKIQSGDVLGLDDVFHAGTPDFDLFIEFLKSHEYERPSSVDVITSTSVLE